MDEYKAPYLHLFNAVTDALKALEMQNYGFAKELLIKGQQNAEEIFISEKPDNADFRRKR